MKSTEFTKTKHIDESRLVYLVAYQFSGRKFFQQGDDVTNGKFCLNTSNTNQILVEQTYRLKVYLRTECTMNKHID